MRVVTATRSLKILDFDVEARPMSWIGQDYVTKEPTAISWKFIGSKDKPKVLALGEVSMVEMLTEFVKAYDEADIVTGHYIRGFDLPLINGALTEYGLPPLKDKLTSDTKIDLVKRHGMSNSQESIGAMLGLEHDKVSMTQDDWRKANRLTPEGIERVKIRVSGDVEQHIEMRAKLIELGYLSAPKLWSSESLAVSAKYHA
jgi:DNA polymerase elongation subunit (family B)